ncbi:M24 family metallopeptidase [Pseudaestuariivita atlantica]|uniref:Peptidase M24 n=1 Tax=Pseudaestuariivita atlantica TaxID=1317121 RepID=A0A0L1JPA7_9RHOB|nr:Xaa-Pro peptidase family protein [Pseudaestuariivita atlantica]KNG93248.1 peptidase M24 [Pseudaestuariivita atlantica]
MTPPRGFPEAEYRARLARAQAMMAQADFSALLLTTEPHVRYMTGFLTRFWESPTRPWFVVVPATGDPVAVIPAIGAHLMRQGWLTDIRTWDSPDYADDGESLLADCLAELAPTGRIGVPMGIESHLRMPQDAYARLARATGDRLTDDAFILRRLRLVKSDAEIGKIAQACTIASRAFARVPEIARDGARLDDVFRRFQMLCLDEGADWVGYLAGAAGPGGYGDVISPAAPVPLAMGDVLMLDTGVVWDGYYCDFDRNYSIGPANGTVRDAHARLIDATHAAHDIARPGATAADLFHAMDRALGGGSTGRLGHGLGMQLTEWPSLIPADHTVLEPGMVLTLEPVVEASAGRILVHEENIVIRDGPAEWLTGPAPAPIPELGS